SFIFAAALAVTPAVAADGHWITSWAAAPLPPTPALGPFPATPGFENQTILQIMRISAGGDRLRLRLTNEYGANALAIGAARIARVGTDGAADLKASKVITFGGKKSISIPPHSPLISDPIDFKTSDLEQVAVSLYVTSATGPCTCHQTGMQPAYVSAAG